MKVICFPGATAGLVVAFSLVCADAGAVVEQTDGTVVPVQVAACPGAQFGCVQTPLNTGEGFAANSNANPLRAVFDATTSPEVFAIPKTNGVFGKVKADDLLEGAGYENSFGWYNVDAPATLYVITPCADEAGSSRTVDFQVELNAGRYLGGFIGFFLITPENQPVGNNCGSLGDVGHYYFTEQARNGDGNYVHYLLYHSKVNPLAFYFGFEDLFRGGDNDFEDMFLKVTGLLAPCVPSPEICDAKDNNCDGLVDNAPIDAGGPCGLSDVGECSDGAIECQSGALVCVGAVGPAPEQCNGLDDDCDGAVDDSPAGVNLPCGTDTGICEPGAQQCIGGVLVCVGGKGPALEVCNSLDDDCNGVADDATIDTGGPCGSNVGACTPGVLSCVAGGIECVGGTEGTPELCNDVDDDCNGAADDGDPEGGGPCGSDVGVCKPGVFHCLSGALECVGGNGPSPEICDGLDNDCDGVADDLAVCPNGSQCVSGACLSPCKEGEFPCPGAQTCVDGFCVPFTCDGVTCPEGETCMQGTCVPDGGAGGAGGGSSPSSTSSSASTSSGAGGASASLDDGHRWGLATGGGGLSCSAGGREAGGAGRGALALLALGLFARRRAGGKRGAL